MGVNLEQVSVCRVSKVVYFHLKPGCVKWHGVDVSKRQVKGIDYFLPNKDRYSIISHKRNYLFWKDLSANLSLRPVCLHFQAR